MCGNRFFSNGNTLQVPKGFVAVITSSIVTPNGDTLLNGYWIPEVEARSLLSSYLTTDSYQSPFDGKVK